MVFYLINERIRGGWFECLNTVKYDASKTYNFKEEIMTIDGTAVNLAVEQHKKRHNTRNKGTAVNLAVRSNEKHLFIGGKRSIREQNNAVNISNEESDVLANPFEKDEPCDNDPEKQTMFKEHGKCHQICKIQSKT